jgi:endonuclease G
MKNLFRPTTACVFSILLAFGSASHAAEDFSACPQFFVNSRPPVVALRPTNRALCFDAFAILHSGESKTPVFVA